MSSIISVLFPIGQFAIERDRYPKMDGPFFCLEYPGIDSLTEIKLQSTIFNGNAACSFVEKFKEIMGVSY